MREGDARIVHENINALMLLGNVFDKPIDLLRLGEIASKRKGRQ